MCYFRDHGRARGVAAEEEEVYVIEILWPGSIETANHPPVHRSSSA